MMGKNVERFEHINAELTDLYEYCKENHLSDETIEQVCAPIFKIIYKEKLKKAIKVCSVIVSLVFLLSFLYVALLDTEETWWHLSAIGRIFLIKILPVWDWTSLKNEKCLIRGDDVQTGGEVTFDCALCESIARIDEIPSNDDNLYELIKLHRPFVVETDTNVTLIESVKRNRLLYDSFPCKLSSNINNGPITLGGLFDKIEMFDSYFLHFQNCDFEAVRAFRSIVPRPLFLPEEVSPIQYSWVLISQNYTVKKFKKVDLVDRVDVFVQSVGANRVRLIPRDPCDVECEELTLKITQGKILVFTSMWNLEYKPDGAGRSVAVILEAH